jgi:hypothetical protein
MFQTHSNKIYAFFDHLFCIYTHFFKFFVFSILCFLSFLFLRSVFFVLYSFVPNMPLYFFVPSFLYILPILYFVYSYTHFCIFFRSSILYSFVPSMSLYFSLLYICIWNPIFPSYSSPRPSSSIDIHVYISVRLDRFRCVERLEVEIRASLIKISKTRSHLTIRPPNSTPDPI